MPRNREEQAWADRPRQSSGGLAAIVAGEGPLVVLLHGVGLRAEAWSPVIDALSDNFQVIAPDMPGHGESGPAASTATLADYVRAIAPTLDREAIIVGHSMGAMIALALAEQKPDRVRGVVALNAIYKRDTEARKAVQTRAAALDGVSVSDPAPTLLRWFGAISSPAAAACHDWLTTVDPRGYRTAYKVFATEDGPSGSTLARLAVPVQFITGTDDPNSTPDMSRKMAALASNGQAQIIEGAAHMLPMTHPETVVSAIRDLAQTERT